MGQVCPQPLGIQAHLVHTNEADGGEMVIKAAKITLCIGIEACIQQLSDDGTLGLQAAGGNVHQVV